ncbi:MAG: hypothetical protein ABIT09_01205 [Croceibacterium sp.]
MADENSYGDGTAAGWKGNKSTGWQAALAVGKDLGRRQRQVLDAFEPYGAAGAICDDICPVLHLPVHVVRPRASELEKQGKLYPVGKRIGALGHPCTVFSVVKPVAPAEAA